MKKTRTWIVVADGARARFFLSEGWQTGLKPALNADPVAANVPGREIGSDRPGRSFESANSMRHAMTPRTDWRQYEKHVFAKSVAQILNDAAARQTFERLVEGVHVKDGQM